MSLAWGRELSPENASFVLRGRVIVGRNRNRIRNRNRVLRR